jgi:hypothetical protein
MEWEHIKGSNIWDLCDCNGCLLGYITQTNDYYELLVGIEYTSFGSRWKDALYFPTLEEAQSIGKLLAACQLKE